MRSGRAFLSVLVALGLAPGTWVRAPEKPNDLTSPVTVERLQVPPAMVGPLKLDGAWVLASENDLFGGWSGLAAWKDDDLLAISDNGRIMVFDKPDRSDAAPRLDVFPSTRGLEKRERDYEALTWSPETNELWVSVEGSNSIWRFATPPAFLGRRAPAEMRGWGVNSGGESLVRLPDGRFIAFREGSAGDGLHEALMFDSDPSKATAVTAFTLVGRAGFRPSDATLLPDGRLLIVLRKFHFAWPPRFTAQLVTADPARIEQGKPLPTENVGTIEPPIPTDNFEGVTVTRETDGTTVVWLISDDNFMRYQRTLLLKFTWVGSDRRNGKRAPE